MRPQYSVRKRLAQIYKANQCTDVQDVNHALESLRELARLNNYHYTAMMQKRLVSLTNKLKTLTAAP